MPGGTGSKQLSLRERWASERGVDCGARAANFVHADELEQRSAQIGALAGVFECPWGSELQRTVCKQPAFLILLVEDVYQVHELGRFTESREEIILLKLLVVILNERPDQSR